MLLGPPDVPVDPCAPFLVYEILKLSSLSELSRHDTFTICQRAEISNVTETSLGAFGIAGNGEGVDVGGSVLVGDKVGVAEGVRVSVGVPVGHTGGEKCPLTDTTPDSPTELNAFMDAEMVQVLGSSSHCSIK